MHTHTHTHIQTQCAIWSRILQHFVRFGSFLSVFLFLCSHDAGKCLKHNGWTRCLTSQIKYFSSQSTGLGILSDGGQKFYFAYPWVKLGSLSWWTCIWNRTRPRALGQNRNTGELMYLLMYCEDIPLVEFMFLAFTCMPGESYCRWLWPLLLYLYDIFQALIKSLVCWFMMDKSLKTTSIFHLPVILTVSVITHWSSMKNCTIFFFSVSSLAHTLSICPISFNHTLQLDSYHLHPTSVPLSPLT